MAMVTSEPPPAARTASITRTSAPAARPNETTRAPLASAASRNRAKCGESAGITATGGWSPIGSSASKISALASAMASSEPRFSMWAGAMVVITATCGRTCRVSPSISPAWFMPISNTPYCVRAGIRARLKGTPTWLL